MKGGASRDWTHRGWLKVSRTYRAKRGKALFSCNKLSRDRIYLRSHELGTILSRDILGRECKIFGADDNYAFERNKYRFDLCYFDKYLRDYRSTAGKH